LTDEDIDRLLPPSLRKGKLAVIGSIGYRPCTLATPTRSASGSSTIT
jgi:hypothetical protein